MTTEAKEDAKVLDPTGRRDSTAALQALFGSDAKTINIPAGTFLIGTDTSLILPAGKTIRGQGQAATILKTSGGIRIPIREWSVDTSVTPGILSVTLASTPLAGQFWDSNFQQFASAFSITASSVSSGVATLSYKVWAGGAPVPRQALTLAGMATIPNGSYVIDTVSGDKSGVLKLRVSSPDYASHRETAFAAVRSQVGAAEAVLGGLFTTSGAAFTGGAPPFLFEAMPNFKNLQLDTGGPGFPMFPAKAGRVAAFANTFKMAVTVPKGAATSGTGGFWVIAAPAIMAFDHSSGTTATGFTLRDLSIVGDATPAAPKQGYSAYTIDLRNSDRDPNTTYEANDQFLNLTFANLAGRAALWLQANKLLLQNLRFENISEADMAGAHCSDLVVRDIVSTNTGWSGAKTWSDVGYSEAMEFDVTEGSNILVDNYSFEPALGSSASSIYAFSFANGDTAIAALRYSGITIQNSTVDVTGLTPAVDGGYAEFFTGGANKITLQNNRAIGWPMAAEIVGDDLVCLNNRGFSFAVAFGQGVGWPPRFSRMEFAGNTLDVKSNFAPDSAHSINMFNFSGGKNHGDYSCNFDGIHIHDNRFTVTWDSSGTPPDFLVHFAEFGDGESGPGCTFTNGVASDNTLAFLGTRPNNSHIDDMFSFHTPVTGSSNFSFQHNRSTGNRDVRHLLFETGTTIDSVKVDGDATANAALLFQERDVKVPRPELLDVRTSDAPPAPTRRPWSSSP